MTGALPLTGAPRFLPRCASRTIGSWMIVERSTPGQPARLHIAGVEVGRRYPRPGPRLRDGLKTVTKTLQHLDLDEGFGIDRFGRRIALSGPALPSQETAAFLEELAQTVAEQEAYPEGSTWRQVA
ncbi:hypothetical protein J8J14_23525 [Roseomonas sp. SSH11]|uniref:Uncharacterized protein n=1 Tax=Pararoseomonas baculiformis TaxID=2820812 RepID=A0ABS4AL32_9PROT|nr:hypothetical protein [Pararoseomonas baculiformis]MBP0447726.1 hypothetical protein [Pararoseomonas baculiformis]